MKARLLGVAQCDSCGDLRNCLMIRVYNTECIICATCVYNTCRWKGIGE
jgi:hypothetical protein